MTDQPYFASMIALPLLAAPLVYLIGRGALRKGKTWGIQLARILTLLTIVADLVLLYINVKNALAGNAGQTIVGLVTLGFDGVALVLTAISLVLGVCVTLFSIPYMKGENNEEKFYALLLITIGSIIGLGTTYNLFNLWVWFEAMAVSTYFLVAFYNEHSASLEAGIKYLTQSAVGSALVLFGIAAVFSQIGSTDMYDLCQYSYMLGGVGKVGIVLMIVGFGVKAAFVPMHTWLPDAHSQAPSGISAMLSGIVIEAGLMALLRVISMVGQTGVNWGFYLIGFACLNILVGNLLALRQTEVKRLLAFSSLAHVGYMLFGLGLGFAYGSAAGGAGGIFHMITHALMKGLAFLAAGALLYVLRIAKGDHSPLTLNDLNGASRKYPIVAIGLSVAVLALAGLPPFAGFMSKWMILAAGVETEVPWVIALVIFVALNSVLSLAYYAPIVNRLFKREQSEVVLKGAKMSWLMVLPIVILVVMVIVIGVWPTSMSFLYGNGVNTLLTFYFTSSY